MRCTVVWLEELIEKYNGLTATLLKECIKRARGWETREMAVVKSFIHFSQLIALSTLLYLPSTLNLWFHFPPKWINLNSVLPSHVQMQLCIPVPWFSPFFSGFWWISRLLSCLTQPLDWFSVCLKDVFELRTCARSWLFSPWYVILGRNWGRGGTERCQ